MDARIHWISQVPDDYPLRDLTLVGTHNSAAVGPTSSFLSNIASCQRIQFKEQLGSGVQLFDLRLRLARGRLSTFHGPVRYTSNFNDLLDASVNHLKVHSYTFLIFIVKEELELISSGLTDAYIEHLNAYKEYLHIGGATTVGELRGKILIISRSTSLHSKYGLAFRWPKHENFYISQGFIVQDVYDTLANSKAEKVRIAFDVKKCYKNHILINYMSVAPYISLKTELVSKIIWNCVYGSNVNHQSAFIILDYVNNEQISHILSYNSTLKVKPIS